MSGTRAWRSAALAMVSLLVSCGGGGGGDSGASSIGISPTSLEFRVGRGAPMPAPKQVTATFRNGDGVLVGYPPGVEPAPWLAVDTDLYEGNGAAPFWFYVVDTNPAGPSVQTTTVRFVTGRADGSNVSYVDMPVRLVLVDEIRPAEDAVSFATEYPVTTASRGVAIQAPGLNWTAQSSQSWLQVSPASGTGSGTLTLTANAAGLAFGDYTATVTLRDQNNHVETIAVGYAHRMPSMTTSFSGYSGSAINGAPIAGGTSSFALSNAANATWTASIDAPWFVPAFSGSGGSRTLAYAIDPATPALASGAYAGTLTVKAAIDATHEVQRTFPVSLTLTPATLTLSTSALELQGISTGDGAFSFTASLNTGTASHPLTVTPTSLDDWLVVDTEPSVSATAGTVTGHADFTAVPSGEYDGTLEVAAQVNGDRLVKTVDVHMLREQWRLFAGRNGVALTSQPGVSRASRTIEVSDTAGGGMAFTAASSQAWLTVGGAGTTPAALTLTANPAGLSAGVHEATVTLTPQTAGADAGETIRVGLYVAAATPAEEAAFDIPYAQDALTDPVRPYVYVIHSSGAAIQAYNVYTGEAGASVATSGLDSLAVSTDGAELYAYSGASRTIFVYALPGLAPLRSIANSVELQDRMYPDYGNTFGFNYARPAGKPVLVTTRLSMLDAQTGAVLSTRGSGSEPYTNLGDTVAVSGDSRRAFLPSPISLLLGYRWSDGTGSVAIGPYADHGAGSYNVTDVATNYDGSRVYGSTAYPGYGNNSGKLVDGIYRLQSYKACGANHPGELEVSVDGLWAGMCQAYYSTDPDIRIYDAEDNLKLSFNSSYTQGVRSFRISSDGAQMAWLAANGPSTLLRVRRMPAP